MRAAVLHSNSDMPAEKIDTPRPGSADILLKFAFCGICGSDVLRIIKNAAHHLKERIGIE